MNSLDALKQSGTVVVSDSGDFELIDVYKPQDATTNPSLILAASNKPGYAKLIDSAVKYAKSKGGSLDVQVNCATDRLLVEFGTEILKIIPGRVSTEVDARLSFDKEATKAKAKELIALYESAGIHKDRILIKIASTWEGIQAARELERDDKIHCNLTLLFGFGQAVACAEAGVTLISPFVGRILDWYKKSTGKSYEGDEDPGVQSVKKIFNYYNSTGTNHRHGRILPQCRRDQGARGRGLFDYCTHPARGAQVFLRPVPKKLNAEAAAQSDPLPKVTYVDNEPEFRWTLLQDQMAFDKLHEGIKKFAEDGQTLKDLLRKKLSA
ncbi:hypothetical protein B0H13DRAFT_2001477 [Mycena leptocephala]|nr:hypothetical protein B0H13DRAFT_2001477 [Mycena leptocephala]